MSASFEKVLDFIGRARSSFSGNNVNDDNDSAQSTVVNAEDSGRGARANVGGRRRSISEHIVSMITGDPKPMPSQPMAGPDGTHKLDYSAPHDDRSPSPTRDTAHGSQTTAGAPPRPQTQRKPVKPINAAPSAQEISAERRKQRINRLKMSKAMAPKVKKLERIKQEPLLESVASLDQRECELLRRAEHLDEQSRGINQTLDQRIGQALIDKLGTEGKLVEFVRQFDRRQSGMLSKIEFRLLVRNGLGLKMDNHSIERFYAKLDEHSSASIDLNRVKVALKACRACFLKDEAATQQMRTDGELLRARCVRIRDVRAATRRYEEMLERRAVLRDAPSLDSRIGMTIVLSNYKLSDVITRWDKKGKGEIGKGEFHRCIVELGVETCRAETEELFNSYDLDGGGTLSIDELNLALKKLVGAATTRHQHLEELLAQAQQERRVLDQRQRTLVAAEAAAEEAIAATEAARRHAAEEARKEAPNTKREKAVLYASSRSRPVDVTA